MRLWCEVYDDGIRRGLVDKLKSVSVTRKLDGAGTVQISTPGTDERALGLLTLEARVRLFLDQRGTVREIGRGVVRNPIKSDNAGGSSFRVDCPDELIELKDRSVLLGRIYGGAGSPVALGTVIDGLVSIADGWTADVEAEASDNLVSARFDGVSVLKALQEMASRNGYHLRQAVGSKVLEFGAFGTDIGLTILNAAQANIRLQENADVALLETISISVDSEQVVNRIYPVGGGEGLAALDLSNSTRTIADGYAINSVTGPDGRTLYYLETGDTPVREEVRRYKITPIANSASAKEVAANALYDACKNDLDRSSVAQETYSCTVAKLDKTVRPGDVVRLVYKGTIKTASGYYTYRDIDSTFTVLDVRENYSLSGVTTSLVISNVDRQPMTIEETLVGAISDVKSQKFEVKTFPYVFNDSWELPVQHGVTTTPNTLNSTKTATFVIPIEDIVSSIDKFKIRFETRHFATQVFVGANTRSSGGDLVTALRLFYQALESTFYPDSVTIKINGIDRTSALGGPWGTFNASTTVELDITEYIVNAAGGLYQDHTIEFDCANVSPSSFNYGVAFSGPAIVDLGNSSNTFSGGNIQLSVSILGTAQAILTS